MTKRLRDVHEFSGRDEAEAARLLRQLAPAAPAPGAEERVYARLASRRRFAPRVIRLAVVAFASVIITAVLGTALAMSFRYRADKPKPPATPSPQAQLPHAASEPEAAAVPAIGAPAMSIAPAPPPSAPVQAQAQDSPPPPAHLPAPLAVRRAKHGTELAAEEPAKAEMPSPSADIPESTATRAAAAPAEEASLVLTGLRLLRRDHDPAQAVVPLGHYLERFPQGALVQEALALAIEASVAKGDNRGAAALAEQYLARFPSGRFIRLAHKAAGSRP